MTTALLKDRFIRKMLRMLFDKSEDLEYIECIECAIMFGYDDLANEFITELNDTERFIYQIHQSEVNKEFSDN